MNLKEAIKHYEDLADYDCYNDEQHEKSKFYREIAEYLILLERSQTLLTATYELLKKQESSSYVLNLLDTVTYYDEAVCDGSCLIDDIEVWNDEFARIIY